MFSYISFSKTLCRSHLLVYPPVVDKNNHIPKLQPRKVYPTRHGILQLALKVLHLFHSTHEKSPSRFTSWPVLLPIYFPLGQIFQWHNISCHIYDRYDLCQSKVHHNVAEESKKLRLFFSKCFTLVKVEPEPVTKTLDVRWECHLATR